jgi:hypothetical protein
MAWGAVVWVKKRKTRLNNASFKIPQFIFWLNTQNKAATQ